jgi:hypothetical protein
MFNGRLQATLDRKAAGRQAKIASKKRNVEAAEQQERRSTMESVFRATAAASTDLDKKAALAKWMSAPESTRYQATKRLQTGREGYISFDVGDLITLTQNDVGTGHGAGVLVRNGAEGLFPLAYVVFNGADGHTR